MLHYLQVALFFMSFIVFSLLALKNRGPIFLFRAVGLCFSILVVFTFNLNWLFKAPLSLWLAIGLFSILSFFIFFFNNEKVKHRNVANALTPKKIVDSLQEWAIPVFFLIVIVGACYVYFGKKLDMPNYSVGDGAIHYKLMTQTVNSGMMPLFLPNELFVDSGNNPDFKYHNLTYFPGTSVAFYIFSKVIEPKNLVSILQILNIVFFGLVSLYLVYIFIVRKKIKNKLLIFSAFFFVATGTFFDFIFNSYTTQLFGLFLLLFFVDTFDEYLEEKISFFVPMFSLGALVIGYFYWLPVALLYVFFSNTPSLKKIFKFSLVGLCKENKLGINLMVVFGGLFLAGGYIFQVFQQNILGYAGAIGGIPRWKFFLPQMSMMLPFAVIVIYFLGKEKVKSFKRIFLFDFATAVFLYAITLWILMLFEKVSGYTMLKILYLVVPIVWILGILFFDELLDKIKFKGVVSLKDFFLNINLLLREYFIKKNLIEITFLFLALLGVVYFRNIKFFPLTIENIKIINEKKGANITPDQMELLDKVKNNFPVVLQDGKIATVAPFETALWVYAYSKIWPRTYALLPEGVKNDNMGSPMSVASAGIMDYHLWLQQDKEHYLIFLDNSSGRNWVKWNGFNFNDYDTLAAVGENKLLKLKAGVIANWSVQKNNPSLKKRESVGFPYAEDFIARAEKLHGLAFKFDIDKKKAKNTDALVFSFFEGGCAFLGEKSLPIVRKEIVVASLAGLDEKDFFAVNFDQLLPDSKNKKYCIKIMSKDGEGKGLRIVRVIKEKELVLNEIYGYQN